MNPTSQLTDREIREALLRRAAASPSPDLIDRIHRETRTVKQNRPLILLPGLGGPATTRLAWAAVLAALLVALVGALVYVGSQRPNDLSVVPPPASPTATSSADPSAAPTVSPTAEPLERGIATVLAETLRVQSEPGEGAELLTPAIPAGQIVFVVDSGVEIEGVIWYAVAPGDPDGTLNPSLPKGWIPSVDTQGQPLVSPIDIAPCPEAPPTVEVLLALHDPVSCYGRTEIQLFATPVAVDVFDSHCFKVEEEPNCTDEPPWLIDPSYVVQPHDGWIGTRPQLWAAAAEDASLAEWDGTEVIFELTGHYDDTAAATCRIYDTVTNEPLVKTPEQAIEDCRQTFVVTDARLATGN